MRKSRPKKKARLLGFLWGFFPWVMVIILLAFVVNAGIMIKEKNTRLKEARKAAIKEEVPAVRVITLSVEPEKLEDKITLPATVEPSENLWVKAEVPGQVVNILVHEGQYVKKGQVLVEVDKRDYVSRLERVEANCKLAASEHERMTRLVRDRIATVTDLEKVETKLKDLNAQLTETQLALSRTKIRAPIDGRLNQITAKLGDWMGVDKPVVQILQYEQVKVTVGVPESDVASVFDLNEADIVIEALENRRVKGKKIFLSHQPRTLARLYDLELAVQNPDGKILPGMFARVELIKKVFHKAISVPLYSIITEGDESFVYVVKNHVAKKRFVKLGILNGWEIQVISGLEPGERVIVVGHRLLDDGQDVEVIKNVTNPREILES